MMPWLLPTRHVRWIMYTGDLIDADEAHRVHLVNRVVPDDELDSAADKLMRKLARMPVPAIKYAKASINYQQRLAGMLDSWQYNVEAIAALHSTKAGRDWMAKLADMSLKEYLDYRDSPFRGLDV